MSWSCSTRAGPRPARRLDARIAVGWVIEREIAAMKGLEHLDGFDHLGVGHHHPHAADGDADKRMGLDQMRVGHHGVQARRPQTGAPQSYNFV